MLSLLSKVFEYVIYYQINQHMERMGFWNKDMNAYRENHSTTTVLMDMTEQWLDNIENREQNVSTFLDLSATFDCMEHRTLVDKMSI